MKKQVIRLFLAIMGIALLLMLVLASGLIFGNYRASVKWPSYVISDYMNTIVELSNSADNSYNGNVVNLILEQVPDTVSGLLIRDGEGNYSLMYGNAPKEKRSDRKTVSVFSGGTPAFTFSVDSSVSPRPVKSDGNSVFEKKAAVFELAVTTSGEGERVEVKKLGIQKLSYVTPSFLSKSDIAGRVYIRLNGEITGSFDVIMYGVHTFGPILFVLTEAMRALLFFIPLAIIIAILCAWKVSKVNSRNVNEIKNALSRLSEGDYSFSLERKMKVDELNEIAFSIESLRKTLIASDESRHEWLLSISHDLNTPVTSLTMLFEGLRDGVFALDEATFSMIKGELGTLSSRINRIAYYTNLKLAHGPEKPMALNIAEAVRSQNRECPEYHISEGEMADAYAVIDGAQLNRALSEAFKNAYEYSVDKAGRVSVGVRENKVVITVSNKGELAEGEAYFEVWKRGDKSRTSGGSGLGLPIIRRIALLGGGDAHISSKEGVVRLEIVLSKADQIAIEDNREPSRDTSENTPSS
jgi:Signal transduction histidine kinase